MKLAPAKPLQLVINTRVMIPGHPYEHNGTVTRVEPTRFRVTFDYFDPDGRKRRSGTPRERRWYDRNQWHNFHAEGEALPERDIVVTSLADSTS